MIVIENLTQTYKSGKGIFDVSFRVEEGEVYGYLGPNGAGKTTTIRGILGQMNADQGTVRIDNMDPRVDTKDVNKILGYLPGEMTFFDNYTGTQFLDYICNMRHLEDQTYRQELTALFELDVNMKIKKMSKGMKQKLGIVSAFMHDPDILILDEPTSGLDPLMQNTFLDLILSEKAKGKTILMSSHIFEEVEKVCDRVGIIKNGRIVAIENLNDTDLEVEDLLVVTLEEENDAIVSSPLNAKKLHGNQYQISVVNNYPEVLRELSNYPVVKINVKKQTIEELFMKYYGGDDE